MSVASAVYERTCHVCDAIRLYFQRTIIKMQRGRQLSANNRIMREYSIEFPHNGDLRYHLNQMNERTNQEYDRKLDNLNRKFKWGWEDNGED